MQNSTAPISNWTFPDAVAQVDRFDDVRDVVQGERKPIEKGILKTNGMDLKQRHC